MIYGYLRVSSDEQDVNSQKQGVEQFAKDKGYEIEQYITDEGVSGGKDPDKRNLGPLLKKLKKGDIVIASEISRLGRDLYMVMDILHFCMKQEVVIYTVKDRFTLGADIQSKVLAFAFGLAAEIERQMIQQRTKEGLKLRVKMGVLLGRAPLSFGMKQKFDEANLPKLKQMCEFGMTARQIAEYLNVNRNTVYFWINEYKIPWKYKSEWTKQQKKRREIERQLKYKDTSIMSVELPREKVIALIEADLTLPEIHRQLPEYTYEQIYDTFMCDAEFNNLYRKHGMLKVKKVKH